MLFHRRRLLIPSAWLSLFALTLLIVAPVYSQMSRPAPMSSMGTHTSGAVSHHHQQAPAALHEHSGEHSDWNHACGYCSLIQQMPFLDVLTPILARAAIIPTTLLIVAVFAGYARKIRFSQAHTRAPPWLSPIC